MNRNGNWELYSILVYNVYYDDRLSVYDENDPDLYANGHKFIISQHQQESVKTKVVSTVFITVNSPIVTDEDDNTLTTKFENFNILGAKLNAANTGVDTTALFMDSYTISGLSFTVKDFENKAIIADNSVTSGGYLDDIVLNYDYGNDSSSFGSYAREDNMEIVPNLRIKLTATSEGSTTYKQSAYTSEGTSDYVDAEQVTIYYAGSYTPALEFVVDNKISTVKFDYSCDTNKRASSPTVINAALPAFKVYSIPPSVQITAASPSGNFDVDSTGTAGSGHTNINHNTPISDDKLTATVYFRCFETRYFDWGWQEYHSYIHDDWESNDFKNPKVTISIADIEKFTGASLDFQSEHVYETVTRTNTSWKEGTLTTNTGSSLFQWSANAVNCERYIGYCYTKYGRASNSPTENGRKTPAGTITANTLSVEHNDIVYIISIPTITINNPY